MSNALAAGTMYHVTQVKQNLKTLLVANMPAMLAHADLQAGDGYDTPVPVRVWTTAKADLEDYPAIEIVVTDSRPQYDTDAQVMRHRLVVGFTLIGDDELRLQAWTERYMWALRHVIRGTLLEPPTGTADMDTGGEQYTPMLQRPAGLEAVFVTGGFLEVIVQTVE